jgi:hypothetical protein
MAPEVGGFGQAAIEAMGVGCVVLADMRNVTIDVERFVKRPPIIDVRDPRELEDWLRLLVRDHTVLDRLRDLSWNWAREHATPPAVAEYWLTQLEAASHEDRRPAVLSV